MKPAPLQFTRYVVEAIHLDLAPKPPEKDLPITDTFEVTLEPLAFPAENQEGELRLVVSLNDGEESFAYYRLRVVVRGTFSSWMQPLLKTSIFRGTSCYRLRPSCTAPPEDSCHSS